MLRRNVFVQLMICRWKRSVAESRAPVVERFSLDVPVSCTEQLDKPTSSKQQTENVEGIRVVGQGIERVQSSNVMHSTEYIDHKDPENEEHLERNVLEMTQELGSAHTNSEQETISPSSLSHQKLKLGVATFRKIVYSEGELDASDLTKPPSRENPHPFHPAAHLPPTHARSIVPFVNSSPALKALVELGVNLLELQVDTQNSRLGHYLVRLDLNKDIKPRVQWLVNDLGFDPSDLGDYLTRNPFFLIQSLEDMKTRVNYLLSKKFTNDQIKKIVIEFRYWLNVDVKTMDARLGWMQKQFSLSGNQVRKLVVKEPRIVMFGLGPLQRLVNLFNKELQFTPSEIKKMLLDDPRLYLMDAKFIIQNYRYVHGVMGIQNESIAKNPLLLRSSLSSIRSRHEFLKHLGRAEYGDCSSPNIDIETSCENSDKREVEPVKLEDFLHFSDQHFCKFAAHSYLVVYDQFQRTH